MKRINVIHRDIKPSNILINDETYLSKICDFGSAKFYHPHDKNISYICSRYYRAPELILGSNEYDCSVDMWSFGKEIINKFKVAYYVKWFYRNLSLRGTTTWNNFYQL